MYIYIDIYRYIYCISVMHIYVYMFSYISKVQCSDLVRA